MKKFDVLGIGGSTVDHLTVVERFPEKDEKVLAKKSSIQGGGQTANSIACLARLGASTAMIGVVGRPPFGQFSIDTLKEEGVDTSGIVVQKDKDPALSSIIIEKGSRTIVSDWGEMENFEVNDHHYELVKNSKIIHSDAHFPEANLKLLKYAKEQGVKICIDSEPHIPKAKEFVSYADYLIISDTFVEKEYDNDNKKALKDFINKGAELAVVTLGKKGACGMQRGDDDITEVPAYDVGEIVDTTGAGDAFHGAFLYGILQDWDFYKNLKFASVCSALKCKKIGGRLGLPSLEEALSHLKKWDI
jgi:ribokinase